MTLSGMNIEIRVGYTIVTESTTARNLGAVFDQEMTMEKQVANTVRATYHQLRKMKSIRQHLTEVSCKKIIHACVTSRLDFYNSLLLGCTDKLKRKLQLVQNNAARVITGLRKREHITPILIQLHWLPIKARISFKVLSIIHKAIHDSHCPDYMKSFIIFNGNTRTLRSTADVFKLLPQIPKLSVLQKSFIVEGFKSWNMLPISVRSIPCTIRLKKCLKTHIFTQFF